MKIPIKQIIPNLFLITIGSILCSITVNGILIPKEFLNGGVMGVSLIFHYLLPAIGLSLIYAVLNLPLFVIGWFQVSRRFMLYTAFGIIAFSLIIRALASMPPVPVKDPILAAILAGILYGLGSGLILRSAGSVGGSDILAVYLYKKFELRMGMTSFLINSAILAAGAIFFSLEMALYTLIFVFTQSRLTDAVITGFNRRKSILIISDQSELIASTVLTKLGRGATYLEGVGAYTGKGKRVLLCVIPLVELARLKDAVFSIDPQAFVVVHETLDVLGKGFGQRKVF